MKNVANIYPLSPVQQGMLFHCLANPGSGVYLNQLSCTFEGDLDVEAFQRAWGELVARHPIFRTAFLWESLKEPLQVVRESVALPWREEDLQGLSEVEQELHLERLLCDERRQDLDLAKAPLMRLVMIRRAAGVYFFIWTHHHLLLDGWSLSLVWGELFSVYDSLRRGAEPPPCKDVGFESYIAWLARQDLARADATWQRMLADFSTPTPLGLQPAGRSLEARAGEQEEHRLVLDVRMAALEALVRRHRLTLNTLVLGAWALVLSRSSGEDDIVFGVTVAGRPADLPGIECMIGLFINTLPLRVRVRSDATAAGWLGQLQEQQLEMRQYEYSPLVQVQKRSGVPGGTPLFESIFVFESAPVESAGQESGCGLRVMRSRARQSSSYPLNILVFPGQRLVLKILYDVGRFDAIGIARLARHLQAVLEDLAEDPDRPLRDLRMLTPAERFQVTAEWNDTATPYDGVSCIHQLFETRVRQRPDAVAVTTGETCLTYRAVGELSGRLARHLRRLGVARGEFVGVYLHRSAEMVPALVGILASGAAYVPLEVSYPTARLSWILGSLGVRVIVTEGALLATLGSLGGLVPDLVQVICLDLESPEQQLDGGTSGKLASHQRLWTRTHLESASADHLSEVARSDDLAYVIFTSGSTGSPKGVVVRHRPVVNLIEWVNRSFEVGPADRVLFITSLCFDLSVYDIFGLLAAGGTIRVASEADVRDPERLTRLLAEEAITFWDSAPAALQQLVPFLTALEGRATQLRLVFLSGDWIPVAMPDRIRSSFPRARVISLGGATEATVWSNFHPIGTVDPHWASIPYGRPIQNARYMVLDTDLEPCPVWTAGDLFIGGECLASGYTDVAITAEKFLPDPFSDQPGARLYRTGDRARFWADGTMEFLGRRDLQVKVRGFRIELGEIEAALGAHPAVRDAVVQAWEGPERDKRLVAYVVPNGAAPDAGELRRYLEERLPGYMVPPAFVNLGALPVTANGKLDRQKLPPPGAFVEEAGRPFVPPRTVAEEVLAVIWAEVLRLERVGIHDNFFEVGGDSILSIHIISRAQKMGMGLSLVQFFEHPTIAELASLVETPGRAEVELRLEPERLYEPFPLTDLQEAYWIGGGAAFELGNLSPHVCQEIEFQELEPERLERALERLIERHPMLRSFVTADGRQQILERVPRYRIEVLDLRRRSAAEGEAALREVRGRMARGVPCDRWPLFMVGVSQLDDRARLHLSLSLLIVDGLTLPLFLDELLRLYRDLNAFPKPLELSFRDYVIALTAFRESDAYRRSREYWMGRVATLPPPPELPLARSPSSIARHSLAHRGGNLEPAAWRRLQQHAARIGVTPTIALCTAYAEVLATWSKTARFTLNILLSNRPPIHPEVTQILGNCSTTLLLEVDSSPRDSFRVRAQRLQQQMWRDLEHSQFTGIRVLRELNRVQGGVPKSAIPVVFTSALNMRSRTDARPAPPGDGRRPRIVWSGVQTPQVWLDHQVGESAGRLGFNWDSVDELFPEGFVATLVEAYRKLLHLLAEDESSWEAAVHGLLPAEQLQLRAEVNATAAPTTDELLHTLFEQRAERHLDRPAVVAADRTLSYGELRHRSRLLAHRLRAHGARPNQLVAVVMEKGWEQVVAAVAVLQAGAAYLPIDPGFPTERLRYLLARGEVEVALTQPALAERLEWPSGLAVLAVADAELAAEPAPLPPLQGVDDLAYVIFTSGSTGLPKGVMIDHRGAVNTILDINRRFGVGQAQEDRVLALSQLTFDLSVYDIFGMLAAGGAVVLPASSELQEPARWAERMVSAGVTVWNSVPALMEMLVNHLESRAAALPPSLSLVLLSGDWIPLSLPERIRALGNGLRVVSLGGATEASIWSIYHAVDRVEPGWVSIPYGRPLDNQTFAVLDEAAEPRPVWVPGHLHIGGIGLAKGYWRDEEKTRASFFVHPQSGEHLYRTGDLGRYLPDGTIEFLGREDFQVKIQGFRIELGEIEAVLAEHPYVRSGVVAAVGEARGPKRLVAYVVLHPEANPSTGAAIGELRTFLASKLPGYMVPAVFVPLESLPLSSNGKVDRGALPVPEERMLRRDEAPAAPRDELELELVRIWEEVLDARAIGTRDDFFELGGHSLLAVRLMGRIRQRFGLDLPLSVLFSGATVEHLARALRQEGPVQRPVLVPIQPAGSRQPFFCVHPVGGSVLCYTDLARLVGSDRPFYGLQAPDLDGRALRVDDLASLYVRELLQVQPEGPYLLGGWSMGGVIAFEMARQLEELGSAVSLVALIDAVLPGHGAYPETADDASLADWFVRDLCALAGHPSALAAETFVGGGTEDLLRGFRARLPQVLPIEIDDTQLLELFAVFRANARALLTYVPRPYAGRVVLFRAGEDLSDPGGDSRLGWDAVALGELDVHVVPGSHYTLVREPHVRALAERLRSAWQESSHPAGAAVSSCRPFAETAVSRPQLESGYEEAS